MSKVFPTFPHSRITRDERGVYTLFIADAGPLNILGSPVMQGLTEALQWIARQHDARALILRGSGERALISGADIHEMAELDPSGGQTFISRLRELCDAVRAVPVPTIARITGHCLGAGMELAAACDIRIGTFDSVYGMPEVRIGTPSVIHALLLPALIGPGAANWLMLTGETVDGRQALAWGFLQFACDAVQLDARIEQTISPIVASGPRAVRSQKALLRYWEGASINDGLDHSVEVFVKALATTEPREYMSRFLTRRRN